MRYLVHLKFNIWSPKEVKWHEMELWDMCGQIVLFSARYLGGDLWRRVWSPMQSEHRWSCFRSGFCLFSPFHEPYRDFRGFLEASSACLDDVYLNSIAICTAWPQPPPESVVASSFVTVFRCLLSSSQVLRASRISSRAGKSSRTDMQEWPPWTPNTVADNISLKYPCFTRATENESFHVYGTMTNCNVPASIEVYCSNNNTFISVLVAWWV